MTVQKLKPNVTTEFEMAQRYYELISGLNNLGLKPMEIKLLAHMAVKGSISNTNNKETFCQMFNSSKSSINNVIYQLSKRGILYKTEGKVKITPQIALNFKEPVILKITLDAETRK